METTTLFQDLMEPKILNRHELKVIFKYRQMSHNFHSPYATGIHHVIPDDLPFPYQERMQTFNDADRDTANFGWFDQNPLTDIEFAEHEIERMDLFKIDDIYVKRRARQYLELLNEIVDLNTTPLERLLFLPEVNKKLF